MKKMAARHFATSSSGCLPFPLSVQWFDGFLYSDCETTHVINRPEGWVCYTAAGCGKGKKKGEGASITSNADTPSYLGLVSDDNDLVTFQQW